MTIDELLRLSQRELALIYSQREAITISKWLINDLFGVNYTKLITQANSLVTPEQIDLYQKSMERLKSKEPIQYILGYTQFLDIKVEVNPSVLIPRPETEELVILVVSHCKKNNLLSPKILDVGTGSGCIGLALAHLLPDSCVWVTDVSEGALETASHNFAQHKLSFNAIKGDFLEKQERNQLLNDGAFDIIISNPPYIATHEWQDLDEQVKRFEPTLALTPLRGDFLVFYRALSDFLKENKGGTLFAEINEKYSKEVMEIMNSSHRKCEIKKDLQGKERMLICYSLQ